MKIYQNIIKESKKVEDNISNNFEEITFRVPKFHPRSSEIKEYPYTLLRLEGLPKNEIFNQTKNHFFLVDESVSKIKFVSDFLKKINKKTLILKSIEGSIKVKSFLDNLIKKENLEIEKLSIVVIGGGLLINCGAYIAERISANLILFPTTILSMADSAGGKVRVNFVEKNRSYKHFYKSFYEPNAMFIDERFLEYLPKSQIKIGLVEIIKHGLFQSPKLYNFLLESGKDLLTDLKKLKKAIFWSVKLKQICLKHDVEENENGSRIILRGGHDFSDRIEEDLNLEIPHGIAVAIGIVKQLEMENDKELLSKAKKMFELLEIPYTIEDYYKWEE